MKKISAKQLCFYGMITAAAMLFGYIETLFPLNFIAPGIKLGLANAVPLFLIIRSDVKGALLVNIVRIFLSAIIFGNPFSLIYSLSAGILSTIIMAFAAKFKIFGIAGISIIGSTVHNLVQLSVAAVTVGGGVLYYLPVILALGILTGFFIGLEVYFISKANLPIKY